MAKYTEFNLAAIQAAPVYFNREKSTEKACRLIKEAGDQGATIAAFSETWLPGYPFFLAAFPDSLRNQANAEYQENAVEIPSDTTDMLCEAARQANIDVVIGVVERDTRTRGTVYCTLLFISSEGTILGRHRKLKPTYFERTVWGEGDGESLTVYERSYGRISGLNCWEHIMVLPGYALMAQGTQIHTAVWPCRRDSQHLLLSRAFAFQGASYVIDVGGLLSPQDVPEIYRDLVVFELTGNSNIIDPFARVIAGPAEGETILMATGSTEKIYAAKTWCDVGGHYSRPDIFQLYVNRNPYERVVERHKPEPESLESRDEFE